MTKSKGRKSGRGFAVSHQRSWLWGRHAVQETLAARRWPILELLLDAELPADILREFTALADAQDVELQYVAPDRILELCHADDHQGVLARLGEYPCSDLWALLADSEQALRGSLQRQSSEIAPNSDLQPLYLICDRIQDAHNFGAILRCCDAMNVTGVVIGERSQAAVSPHVVRASAGAVNHVAVYRVPLLTEAVDGLSQRGFTVAAATEKTSQSLWSQNLRIPTALIIGSEAFGVAQELLDRCSLPLTIPMLGQISSLNAAVAAGIILYEIRRQQKNETTSDR